jgi:glucose-1-phosphate thymidylyltransferase
MKKRKGIVLAGGFGTRLHPLTKVTSKQLLPIFNKPMIFYPISNLIMSGIKDVLIISTPEHVKQYNILLGDGRNYGIKIQYKIQKYPNGIAEGLILAEKFLNGSDLSLILGDNIFYGKKIKNLFLKASKSKKNSIFVKEVPNPNNYGVIKQKNNVPEIIIEKPTKKISKYAVTGFYFYSNKVIKFAKKLKPSKRNELEITDLNNLLIKKKNLNVHKLNKDHYWHDAGNHVDYLKTCNSVKSFESKYNTLIGSLEYESYKKNNLSKKKIIKTIEKNNFYYEKLRNLLK